MGQDRESLRDLDGVRVAVQDLPPAAVASGVSVMEVRRAVEAALAQASISVLGTGDFPVGDPFLRIRINATPEARGLVGYTVDVDFVQMTFMRRNPAVTFNRAQTWLAAPHLGLVEASQVRNAIMENVLTQVEQFVGEYRMVNSR